MTIVYAIICACADSVGSWAAVSEAGKVDASPADKCQDGYGSQAEEGFQQKLPAALWGLWTSGWPSQETPHLNDGVSGKRCPKYYTQVHPAQGTWLPSLLLDWSKLRYAPD